MIQKVRSQKLRVKSIVAAAVAARFRVAVIVPARRKRGRARGASGRVPRRSLVDVGMENRFRLFLQHKLCYESVRRLVSAWRVLRDGRPPKGISVE
jgi:hypothetical protein